MAHSASMSQPPALSNTDGPTLNRNTEQSNVKDKNSSGINVPNAETSNKNGSKSGIESRRTPRDLIDLFGPLECKLCCVKVETPITAYTHYKGNLHIKKLKAYLWEHDRRYVVRHEHKLRPTVCNICQVVLTSEIQARQHYSGKLHMKNVWKSKEEPWLGSGATYGVPVKPVTKATFQHSPPVDRYYCHACCAPTTSPKQLENHKKGSKHIKRMRKYSSSGSDCRRDLSIYRTPSDQYYCPQCNITSNSSEQFIQHIDSRKHKRISRIKVHD